MAPVVASDSALLSLRAYARSRKARNLPGGTLRAVQKAIETGRIAATAGKIDPAAADKQWEESRHVDYAARAATAAASAGLTPPAQGPAGEPAPKSPSSAAAPKEKPPAAAPEPPAPPDPEMVDRRRAATLTQYSFLDARARREAAQADLADLELRRRRGELIPALDVARATREQAAAIRDRLSGAAVHIGKQFSFSYSLDERQAIASAKAVMDQFLFDVANELDRSATAA